MRATIKIIAERAGVSIGTVDRVLHDRPYVKEEVRRRVLEVMEELDYQPNRVASALATSGMARHFAIIQPTWESYVGEAMAAGVAKFRQDRQDYNVSVTIHPYRQGRMAACTCWTRWRRRSRGSPCAPRTAPRCARSWSSWRSGGCRW